jgi:hypothetical protein
MEYFFPNLVIASLNYKQNGQGTSTEILYRLGAYLNASSHLSEGKTVEPSGWTTPLRIPSSKRRAHSSHSFLQPTDWSMMASRRMPWLN